MRDDTNDLCLHMNMPQTLMPTCVSPLGENPIFPQLGQTLELIASRRQ